MKNMNSILLGVFLIVMNYSNAQLTITLDSLNGAIVNGSEVIHDLQVDSGSSTSIHYDFYVTNNTGVDQDWLITRKIISQSTGWGNYLCWEELCYPVSPSTEWNSSVGNVANTETSILSAYIYSTEPGTANLRYYISSDGIDFVDSVDVVITTFLNLNSEGNFEYKLYPTPALNEFTIEIPPYTNAEFNMYSMSGKLIFTRFINEIERIDVSDLEKGCYLYTLKDLDSGIIRKDKISVIK